VTQGENFTEAKRPKMGKEERERALLVAAAAVPFVREHCSRVSRGENGFFKLESNMYE